MQLYRILLDRGQPAAACSPILGHQAEGGGLHTSWCRPRTKAEDARSAPPSLAASSRCASTNFPFSRKASLGPEYDFPTCSTMSWQSLSGNAQT